MEALDHYLALDAAPDWIATGDVIDLLQAMDSHYLRWLRDRHEKQEETKAGQR